ncbi:hypothetical protein [Maribacter spongiicola]
MNTITKPLASQQKKEVEFIFENNSNSMKNLSNYITKNKINLLCVNRFENKKKKDSSALSMPANISDMVNNINVPLLLMGQNNYTV